MLLIEQAKETIKTFYSEAHIPAFEDLSIFQILLCVTVVILGAIFVFRPVPDKKKK